MVQGVTHTNGAQAGRNAWGRGMEKGRGQVGPAPCMRSSFRPLGGSAGGAKPVPTGRRYWGISYKLLAFTHNFPATGKLPALQGAPATKGLEHYKEPAKEGVMNPASSPVSQPSALPPGVRLNSFTLPAMQSSPHT